MDDLTAESSEPTISSEITVKSYTIDQGTSQVTNKVKIKTMQKQDVGLEDAKGNPVNRDQTYPKKLVTKQVWIDNDADEDYDETLKFRYMKPGRADDFSDFVLVTNNREIFIAIDEGESLKILEAANLSTENLSGQQTESVIYTDQDGEKVNFYIDSFAPVTTEPDSSR